MTKPRSTAGGVVFDLAAAERELRQTDAYVREGHAARTLVREPDLRIVLLVMKADGRIAEHRADETASIHALGGHLRLHMPDRVVDLPAGRLLVLERGILHDVEAVLESAFLLTLGWERGRGQNSQQR
jgi:quercetin dioxygenase-like cupin family protein